MLGVDVFDVVQLLEVVEDGLPVACEGDGLVSNERHRRQVIRCNAVDQRPEVALERFGVGVGAHPHHSERAGYTKFLEGVLCSIDAAAGESRVVRDHDQAAVGPVAPTVIGAGEALFAAAIIRQDARTAVLAHVEVGRQVAVVGTRHDDRLASDVEHDVLAGFGHVALEASELPHLGPQLGVLACEPLLGGVSLRRDGLPGRGRCAVDGGRTGHFCGHGVFLQWSMFQSFASWPPSRAMSWPLIMAAASEHKKTTVAMIFERVFITG
jgi:hypothetical protein